MGPALALLLAALAGTGENVEGELRLHEFHSETFQNTRMLRVLLPAGYDAPENRHRRYPVLYLNDGQNLFDVSTSVLNPMEWRVDETVHALVAARKIAPIIVVGIDSAGRRGRFKEYFPYVDEYLQPPEPNPQGTRYPAFLVDEVIPFIEDHYRVVCDPAGRGIGGSSAGALAAIYAVVARPGVFGRLLIESPSIYVDDAHILRDASKVATWPERIYLGVGTNERGQRTCDPNDRAEPELVRDVRRFERLLRDAHVDAARIRLTIAPCAVHDEAAWAARLPDALTFLYGDNNPTSPALQFDTKGVEFRPWVKQLLAQGSKRSIKRRFPPFPRRVRLPRLPSEYPEASLRLALTFPNPARPL